MGVLLYGTVDFTNCALITNWDWLISCVDVAWGTTGERMVETMYRIALGCVVRHEPACDCMRECLQWRYRAHRGSPLVCLVMTHTCATAASHHDICVPLAAVAA